MSAAVQHLEDCIYLPITCPLGCVSLEEEERKEEVVKMERRLIPEHLRDSCPMREVVCEFCEGEVKAREMNPHLKDCMEFPLPCPNGCSREGKDGVRELKRKDIPIHLDNHCPLHKVQCSYWDHGCKKEMERRDTDTHEREFLHIHFKLYITYMNQKQNASTQLLQHELSIANDRIVIANEKITLQELQFTESLNAATNRIEILEKQNSDKDIQIASLTTTFTLLSSLPTGRLEWNIKGVKQGIRNKEQTYSDPFYVGFYKCQGYISWNSGNLGYVAVWMCIMKGNFDDKLHWPIRYKYTFVLINQINSKDNLVKSVEATNKYLKANPECFEKPTGDSNPGFRSISLISITDILNKKYCRQDSITLHISVELLSSL